MSQHFASLKPGDVVEVKGQVYGSFSSEKFLIWQIELSRFWEFVGGIQHSIWLDKSPPVLLFQSQSSIDPTGF